VRHKIKDETVIQIATKKNYNTILPVLRCGRDTVRTKSRLELVSNLVFLD